MQGTIYVEKFMDYAARQRRMLEWLYLKEFWRASEEDRPRILELYGKPLQQALAKHRKRYDTR
jgi:hypothetical protein